MTGGVHITRMKYKISTYCAALCAAVMALSCISANAAGGELKARAAQAVQGLKDLKLTCKVTYCNMAELKKISGDFSKRYEFKTSTLMFKSPDKMKMEGKLGMVTMKMVINGDRKAFIIPAIGYHKKENIKGEPHKRQSDFDIGIFSDTLWSDYIVTDVERVKNGDGTEYRIVFRRANTKEKKQVCWVDAESLRLRKLENFESDGSLKTRFVYSDHKKLGNGVWLPMKIDIYNGEGKLAASTEYQDVSINTGISDSEFNL